MALLTRRVTAGGVVFLEDAVLVMRTLRNSWVMPKGGVGEHETPEQAAVREVEEESGAPARVVSWVGGTSYRIGPEDRVEAQRGGSQGVPRARDRQRPNVVEMAVRWYLMEAVSPCLCPEAIFTEVVYVPVATALARLSYHTDRGILQKAAYLRKYGPLLPFARPCPSHRTLVARPHAVPGLTGCASRAETRWSPSQTAVDIQPSGSASRSWPAAPRPNPGRGHAVHG